MPSLSINSYGGIAESPPKITVLFVYSRLVSAAAAADNNNDRITAADILNDFFTE